MAKLNLKKRLSDWWSDLWVLRGLDKVDRVCSGEWKDPTLVEDPYSRETVAMPGLAKKKVKRKR